MRDKTETKNHRITIRLDDKLMESIRNRSESSNQRVSAIVRRALENELYGGAPPHSN